MVIAIPKKCLQSITKQILSKTDSK